MTEPFIQVHHVLGSTRVNGPGDRALVHVQGCGGMPCASVCFNQATHNRGGGTRMGIGELVDTIQKKRKGKPLHVTISGGEPLQQKHLSAFIGELRARGADSIVLFSGYPMEVVIERFRHTEHPDVVIAGPYDPTQPNGVGLSSSSNQTLVFLTDRHTPHEFTGELAAELHYTSGGKALITGFPTAEMLVALHEGRYDTL